MGRALGGAPWGLEAHGKPLDGPAWLQLQLTGGFQQPLGPLQGGGQPGEIGRHLVQGVQMAHEPSQGVLGREDLFAPSRLQHYVMIEFPKQGIRHWSPK